MPDVRTTLDDFCQAIEAAGLGPPDSTIDDGGLRRFSSKGERGDDSGWYVLYADDCPTGLRMLEIRHQVHMVRQDRSTDDGPRTGGPPTTCGRTQRERDEEEQRQQAEAAALAPRIWQSAAPALSDHPYLVHKGCGLMACGWMPTTTCSSPCTTTALSSICRRLPRAERSDSFPTGA